MRLGIQITGATLAVALVLVVVHLLAPLFIAAAVGLVVLAWLKRSVVETLAGVARILDEIAKCDIVCANRHRARIYDRRMAVAARE